MTLTRTIKKDNVYEISNAGQLYWFAYQVNKDSSGKAAVLENDITVNTGVLKSDGSLADNPKNFRKWIPIGLNYNKNEASFYGNGHTIRGLYFDDSEARNVGFFGFTGGKISNVGVIDSYFNGGAFVGGVCGENCSGTIENCYNTGTVSGKGSVGGVCGSSEIGGKIENCNNTGKVSGSGDDSGYIGGVCGLAVGTITNCYYLDTTATGGINGADVTGSAEVKTADDFASGEVAYLLNGSSSENPVWYQNIDRNGETADAYPVIDSNHGTVYQCTPCTAVYSNALGKTVAHIFHVDENDSTQHTCKKCGTTESHSKTNFSYSADEETNRITVYCNEGECGANIGYVELAAPSETITYDGTAKEATVSDTVTDVDFSSTPITYKQGGTTLTSAPTNVGTYTASITLGDRAGAKTVSVTYSIKKVTPYIKTKPSATFTYGQSLGDLIPTGGVVQYSESKDTIVEGNFTWKDTTIKPTAVNSNTKKYTVVFKPNSGNYDSVETDITVTVNKAQTAPNMPGNTMSAANSKTKVSDITLPTGWVWQEADKNKALTIDKAEKATAVYNGADKGNYVEESVEVTITRSECEHVASDILYTGAGEKEPTCTEDGKGHRECTKCKVIIESNIIVKAAHQFSTQWTIDKPATTTEEGEKSRHCTRADCDARTDITVIPKLSTGGGGIGGGIIGGGDNTSQFWPDAKKELEQALNQEPGKEPPVVTINIKDNTTVPKDVLETIKGKNIEVVFDLGNGISWKLNGNDIKNISSDLDLGVNTNTNTIPVEVINKVTGEKTSLQLSLNHDGDFGFTATLTINLDAKNKGLYANLYYYNPKAAKGKELEFISAGKIDGSGNADLQFTHASDYVIVIDRTPADTTITKEKWTVNSNIMNKLAKLGWQNNALKVQWSKVEGAEGYDIFATTYGGKITAKTKVATVAANKTSLSISKVLGKKVSNQTGYKVRVKAYRMVNGKKQYLGETMDLFTVGSKHKAYTNVSKVTPKNATITLTVGKKQKVTTTLTKADQKKKLLPTKFVAVRRYFVEDSTIVKVDQNGNLTALKKGKTTLYIKASNGTTAKVTITVK